MTSSLALSRPRAAELLTRRRLRVQRSRVKLGDGSATTLHAASYERGAFSARVVSLERPAPLASWCQHWGVRHAVVGGFFRRPDYTPLGELRIGGESVQSVAFDAPWSDVRCCLQIVDGSPLIARRNELAPHPEGDVLQAGPLLVKDGVSTIVEGRDLEGFSAGARQFDSDITQGRYPRAALAVCDDRLLAVACDGRTRADAGMTLAELANVLVELGATAAINLDGGGSASLVHNGRLRNRPREEHGVDLLGGRPVVTAIVFEQR